MQINENTFDIYAYQYDWGVPVNFEAGKAQGFSINDQIVFTFGVDTIADKIFDVSTDDFTFALAFTKEEADSISLERFAGFKKIPYSAKRYRGGQFLETIVNANLIIGKTVRWEGEPPYGEANSTQPADG